MATKRKLNYKLKSFRTCKFKARQTSCFGSSQNQSFFKSLKLGLLVLLFFSCENKKTMRTESVTTDRKSHYDEPGLNELDKTLDQVLESRIRENFLANKTNGSKSVAPLHPSLWRSHDKGSHFANSSNIQSTENSNPTLPSDKNDNPRGTRLLSDGTSLDDKRAPNKNPDSLDAGSSFHIEPLTNSFCSENQSLDIFEITKVTTVPIVASMFRNGSTNPRNSSEVDGQNLGVVSAECESRHLENTLLTTKSTRDFTFQVEQHLKKCGSSFQSGGTSGLLSLLRVSSYNYPFCSSPRFRKLKLTLVNGEKILGLLAMKPGPEKRPLVVIKCGLFCGSANSPSTRDFFMHYFDQSPFHVLFLGNRSGLDFIQENKIFAVGGWEEGAELVNVGLALRSNSELMSRISSLHLAGISLGGGGALFASHGNDEATRTRGSIYNSVTAICPVVDLQATLDTQFSVATGTNSKIGPAEQWIGVFFYNLLKSQLLKSRSYLKGQEELIDPLHMPPPAEMTKFLGQLSAQSLNTRHPSVNPDSTTWLQWNNFLNFNEKLRTPTLVITASNDSIVRTEQNALKLRDRSNSLEDDNLGVVILNDGNHCAFSASFGHKIISTILRDHILRNSPEFINQYIEKPTGINFDIEVENEFRHSGQKIIFKANDSTVYIQIMITEKMNTNCKKNSGVERSGRCLRTLPLKEIPIAKLAEFGARTPENVFEASMLTREFNGKFNFFAGNELLTGSNSKSIQLRSRTGY